MQTVIQLTTIKKKKKKQVCSELSKQSDQTLFCHKPLSKWAKAVFLSMQLLCRYSTTHNDIRMHCQCRLYTSNPMWPPMLSASFESHAARLWEFRENCASHSFLLTWVRNSNFSDCSTAQSKNRSSSHTGVKRLHDSCYKPGSIRGLCGDIQCSHVVSVLTYRKYIYIS